MARAFDLLSSEYGWTDDQILDLTLERIRQIVDVVGERRTEQRRHELGLEELKLTIVGQLFAGSAQSREQAKAIQRYVAGIRLYPRPAGEDATVSDEAVMMFFGAADGFDMEPLDGD